MYQVESHLFKPTPKWRTWTSKLNKKPGRPWASRFFYCLYYYYFNTTVDQVTSSFLLLVSLSTSISNENFWTDVSLIAGKLKVRVARSFGLRGSWSFELKVTPPGSTASNDHSSEVLVPRLCTTNWMAPASPSRTTPVLMKVPEEVVLPIPLYDTLRSV